MKTLINFIRSIFTSKKQQETEEKRQRLIRALRYVSNAEGDVEDNKPAGGMMLKCAEANLTLARRERDAALADLAKITGMTK